jgi:aspartate/methionine/tyrosine aminotransferase
MRTSSLTELELPALRPEVLNLSDGHARQSVGAGTRARLREIVEAALSDPPADYFDAERRFLDDLSRHTGQSYPARRTFVTYASSVAMGVVSTHLKRSRRRVGLICPAFDNLAGILASMDVPLTPVPEHRLAPEPDLDHLESLGVDALVLVLPNNPTGACAPRAAVCRLMDWAAARGVLLVVDLAFRWFDDTARWDLRREAEARGADLVSIDDTGKVLSLSDLKAGVLSTTHRLAEPIGAIHRQYVLNVSELGLRLLAAMLAPGHPDDEVSRARRLVRENRAYLDDLLAAALAGSAGDPRLDPPRPGMSVAWLRVPRNRDLVTKECHRRGVEILAGDHFHWATDVPAETHVRLALLRDAPYFARAADVVADVLARLA